MISRNLSWEIILAGLAFVGIAIFMLNSGNNRPNSPARSPHLSLDSLKPPKAPLPPSFVIDLQNLENLKNLRNLKNLENLENLKHLEIELKHLDKILENQERAIEESTEASVDQTLEKLEKRFQEFEEGSFDIRLQDNKVFINRRFKVEESSWSEVSPGVYLYRTSFDMRKNEDIGLNLGFGNVNIVGSDSTGGELVLQATGDVENPQLLADHLQIRSANNRSYSISQKGELNLSDRIDLEATLTVPSETNFNVKTSGGHISATHLRGNQHLVTSGGHITLDDLIGSTYAKTSGGHITSDRIEGDANLSTSGGHIRIAHANGSLKLHTGGGNIRIESLQGQAQAKTSGGNISAGVQSVNGPMELTTSAGNISLLLPPSINADITAHGTETTIEQAFDFNGTRTNGKIEGTINGGGIPISIHCGYGNVSIKTNDTN
ncbi:MAG: DUF4097 family beta strand repeat-containing protein [Balneolaceae bacterium]|nr:DUF4097 family beta strand repeat-containing protein [Balneolaceae bacterium]